MVVRIFQSDKGCQKRFGEGDLVLEQEDDFAVFFGSDLQ